MADPSKPAPSVEAIVNELPPSDQATIDSFDVKQGEGFSEKVVDSIEMIGEEHAAGLSPAPSEVTPGMRYLHSSRTIHQLVTDRNRAVGIFLAVASLLLTASGAIFHANPQGSLIIPMDEVQRWCLPITFLTLTILAIFMAFLLIRTRVGLIYEVAKMNVLLGLPIGRVSRISPLSIHSIMHGLISLAGGGSAVLFTIFMVRLALEEWTYTAAVIGVLVGVLVTAALIALYAITVTHTTSDERLKSRV